MFCLLFYLIRYSVHSPMIHSVAELLSFGLVEQLLLILLFRYQNSFDHIFLLTSILGGVEGF